MRETTLSEILARKILIEHSERSLFEQLKIAAKTLGFKDIKLYRIPSDDGYLGIYAIFDGSIEGDNWNINGLRRQYIFHLEYCISMLTRCKVRVVTDWHAQRERLYSLEEKSTVPFEEITSDKFKDIFKCLPEEKYLAQLDPNLDDDLQDEDDRGYLFNLSTLEGPYKKLPPDKQPFKPEILEKIFYQPPPIETKEKEAKTDAKPFTAMKRSYKEDPSSGLSDKNILDQKRQRTTPKVK